MKPDSVNFPQRQRGVIGILGAMLIGLVMALVVVVIDSGRLWFAQRNLQQIADVAAISAANQIGCDGSDEMGILAAAQAAAVANGFTGNLANLPNLVALGRVNTNVNGVREFSQSAVEGNLSVRVVATQSIPTSLIAPLLYGDDTLLSSNAVAITRQPTANFSVASGLVNLTDTGLLNGLLSSLLGAPVNLTVASFNGLANVGLSIFDLINAGLNVGTVNEALDAQIDIAQFLTLTANALNQDNTLGVDLSAINQIASIAVPGVAIRLGDILSLGTATEQAGLDAKINALDLVTASLMLANKNNFLALDASVHGVTGAGGITLRVIEPPQLAVGVAAERADGSACTVARTAQVRLNVPLDINVLGLLQVKAGVAVEVAQASAELKTIQLGFEQSDVVIDAQPGIASVRVSGPLGTDPLLVKALGITLLEILPYDIPLQNPTPDEMLFEVDHPIVSGEDIGQSQTVSNQVGASIENALAGDLDLRLLGINLGVLLTPVLQLVGVLVGNIVAAVVDPLLQLLGVQVGTATVTLHHLNATPGGQLVI